MATKNGFYRRTGWKLTREIPPATTLLRMRFASELVDPLKCDHPSPVFNGYIWFCKKCGEPVHDRDERRQAEIPGVFE